MAINPNLLVAAPMLQDYLVDKTTGLPLANGKIYLYQDNSRTTLKNWYYQSGTAGAYTYIPLDNPLTLSAVGTIQDSSVSGNDVIPFYYPFDETDNSTPQPYFIQVYDSNALHQWDRQNFPFMADDLPSPTAETSSLVNSISNNVFYHNVGSINVSSTLNAILAPSQHDGFVAANLSHIRFIKNIIGATDNISFLPFSFGSNSLTNDVTPEFYLNLNCSGSIVGETSKYISFPISSHLKTLDEQRCSFSIWAQNVSPNVNNQIEILLGQFYGSGSASGMVTHTIETITLNNTWTRYDINFVTPSTTQSLISSAGDDGWFLLVQYPLSVTCNINFTKPFFKPGDRLPSIDFQTYSEIGNIINTPGTGDFKNSLNDFVVGGWVPCNDGTIANNAIVITPPGGIPLTRSNIDTWQLFNLIWNKVGVTYAPMFDSAGTATTYGANAYADWNANKQISLTKTLGRVLASIGIPSAGGSATNWVNGQIFGEDQHTQTISEMPAHDHPGSVVSVGTGPSTNTASNNGNSNTGSASLTIASQGSGNPFNVIQPTVHVNVFLKL